MTTDAERRHKAHTELRLARIEYALCKLAADMVHAFDPPQWAFNKQMTDILYGFRDEEILALREGSVEE